MDEAGAASRRSPTILALGGHEFSRKSGNEAIRDYMLELTARRAPRICLLPTASGDPADQIAAFRSSFAGLTCELSHISLFRLETEAIDLTGHLLAQDLIYVGGGSMVNLLAIWRAHGIDEILRRCWEHGVVLVGQSAGAMCWFECGVTRSAGAARVAPGLGFVGGLLSVHYHRDPDRRLALLDQVATREQRGYGIDDGAGLLIRDDRIETSISAREGAAAWRLDPDSSGRTAEVRMAPVQLDSPRPPIDEVGEDVFEMRRVIRSRTGVETARARRIAGR